MHSLMRGISVDILCRLKWQSVFLTYAILKRKAHLCPQNIGKQSYKTKWILY